MSRDLFVMRTLLHAETRTRRSSNAATAWQELLQHLVWSVLAAAGLPASDAPDGAHTQVTLCHHHLPSQPLQPPSQPGLPLTSVMQALHGFGDMYQDDYWSRRFAHTCSAAALKCKGSPTPNTAQNPFFNSQRAARPPAHCSGYGGRGLLLRQRHSRSRDAAG